MDKKQFKEWEQRYKLTLLTDIVPFWIKHGIDRESGAIVNAMDDAGNIISTDRYLWSQGRALWTFSALYNRIRKESQWLDVAHGIFSYLSDNGRDENGAWMYRLDEQGRVLDRDISIYVDGFVLNGLGEYVAATGDERAAVMARRTADQVLERLEHPETLQTAPYTIPEGMKTHGIAMIFSYFLYNLGEILGEMRYKRAGYSLAMDILTDFYDPQQDAVLEFVSLDGSPNTECAQGRTCVPGHVIEGMWFLLSIFERENEHEKIKTCCSLIRRHIELGWDKTYGGIRLAVDIMGRSPIYWEKADYKPWWVQVEALVATAYAYLHTKESWCTDWHEKIHTYAYEHYPTPYGEWTQWLDRTGKKASSAALPVKDPFHLPRGLITLISLCNRIVE